MKKLLLLLSVLSLMGSALLAGPITTGQWYEFGFVDHPGGATFGCAVMMIGRTCEPSSGGRAAVDFSGGVRNSDNLGRVSFQSTLRGDVCGQSVRYLDVGSDSRGDCGSDPDVYVRDPKFSKVSFFFVGPPRLRSFTINDIEGVSVGVAYFRIDVPEPGSILLTGAGLLGAMILRRRRQARQPQACVDLR